MQSKVDGIYEFTGLREFADLPLKYYSSGMYTRLAFAIATEVNPDILLIDESLGAGDAAFLDKARARILNLLDRSWTRSAICAVAASGCVAAGLPQTARSRRSSTATSRTSARRKPRRDDRTEPGQSEPN